MPRILRNYLISFAVIGVFLLIMYWIDQYRHSDVEATAPPSTESTISAETTSQQAP